MTIGHQAGALGVPMKVHTQRSIGKPVTGSMDEQIKLEIARKEAKARQREPISQQPTISTEDARELVAGLDLRIEQLAGCIDEGKATLESIKESLDPRIAKLTELIPTTKEGQSEITHITKGKYQKIWGKTPPANIVTKGGQVRWEYALDTIAQELHLEGKAQTEGKNPDEYLKGLIEEAKDTKELIRATDLEVRSDESTLKALEKLKGSIKGRVGKTTTETLLRSLAKPTLKGKPKPVRKAEKMLASVAQALIEKTQAKRTSMAIVIDNAKLAKRVVPMSKVELWAKQPNRYDILRVDTPRRHSPKIGIFTDRRGERLSRRYHRGWKRAKFM